MTSDTTFEQYKHGLRLDGYVHTDVDPDVWERAFLDWIASRHELVDASVYRVSDGLYKDEE